MFSLFHCTFETTKHVERYWFLLTFTLIWWEGDSSFSALDGITIHTTVLEACRLQKVSIGMDLSIKLVVYGIYTLILKKYTYLYLPLQTHLWDWMWVPGCWRNSQQTPGTYLSPPADLLSGWCSGRSNSELVHQRWTFQVGQIDGSFHQRCHFYLLSIHTDNVSSHKTHCNGKNVRGSLKATRCVCFCG